MFGYDHHYFLFGAAGWIGLIFMILFWIGVIALIIWGISALVSSSHRNTLPPSAPREDSAMRILRERYARGEIDTEQFEQARRTLEGGGS